MFKISLILVVLGFSLPQAYSKASFCDNIGSSRQYAKGFSYCVDYPTDQIDHSKVIYFFHGIFGSERSWFKSRQFQKMRGYMLKSGFALPPVVTISFGRTWLVNRRLAHNPHTGLYEQMINQVFPYLEQQVLGVRDPQRLGIGMSMGGFNLTQIHLQSPTLFHKIALTCPAMAIQSPHSARGMIKNFIRRNAAKRIYVLKAMSLSKKYFSTPDDWNRYSPLEYLKRYYIQPSNTEFYISAVSTDEFGFLEGDKALAEHLDYLGYRVNWEMVRGNHCDINPLTLANFLTRP